MEKTRLATAVVTAAVILSGCAERGYQISVQKATHTVTAEQSTDLRSETTESTKETLRKMNRAVKKALRKSTQRKKDEASHLKQESNAKRAMEAAKAEKALETKRLKTEAAQRKLAAQEAARKEEAKRQALEQKALAEQTASQKAEEAARLEEKRKTAEMQLKRQKALEEEARKKAALEKEKAEKEKARLAALKEKKRKEELLQQKEKMQESTPQKNILEEETTPVHYAEPIRFLPMNKTYQKYGTSEIHGHVIYLSPAGEEIALTNGNVYLLPVGPNLNFWYKNFYLKNKDFGLKKVQAHYLNKTALDLDRNFAFYGVPAGNYYIIIEATDPRAKHKKLYIAKKIKVDKYKKVMAVFSKRL